MIQAVVREHDATRMQRTVMWTGRVISILPVLVLLVSARLKLTHDSSYVAEWVRIGYAPNDLTGIGMLQLALVMLYVIPSTAVLGTVLLTGYLGGAIAAYVRLGEPYTLLVPLSTALLAWAGVYMREDRLRSLLPLRRKRAR